MSTGEKIGKFMIKDSVENKMPIWVSFTSTKDLRKRVINLLREFFLRYIFLLLTCKTRNFNLNKIQYRKVYVYR